jgi:hypothetical protein
MKTSVLKVSDTSHCSRFAYQWEAVDSSGRFIAGGYCRTESDAKADLAHWQAGNSIRNAPSVISEIGHSL